MNEFGEVLRRVRKEAGKTLADVADILGVSISYVSDVERGRRDPWASERIHQLARGLGVDPAPLLQAAATSRGAFQLAAKGVSPKAHAVGLSLMRRWTELSDEQLQEIALTLDRRSR